MFLKFIVFISLINYSSSYYRLPWNRVDYTIIYPRTIRMGSSYSISISLTHSLLPCQFRIRIGDLSNQELNIVKVEPQTTKLFKFKAPIALYGITKLNVNAFDCAEKQHESSLNVERGHKVYIQTDKSKYKPGQLVQFRAIFIDIWMRPATLYETTDVRIYDGDDNLIKQLSNVQLKHGVLRDEAQISQHPVLGDWKIKVFSGGEMVKQKSFLVIHYKLPTFIVNIISKKDVSISEGHFELNISARHTYGEPVKGNSTISIRSTYSAYKEPKSHIINDLHIDGNVTVNIKFGTDLNITAVTRESSLLQLYKFEVKAVVKDSVTGETSQSTTEVTIYSHPFKIDVTGPNSFQQDKPINTTISVRDLEGNPKIDNITIIFEGRTYRSSNMRRSYVEKFGRTVTELITSRLDENGVANCSLNKPHPDMQEYSLTVEFLGYRTKEKRILKSLPHTFELEVLTQMPEVGNELHIKLTSSNPIHYFVYNIIARGSIIHAERINVPGNDVLYILRINVTDVMAPKSIFYIHRAQNGKFDGRMKVVKIEGHPQNSINIYTENEAKPGSEVYVNVTTDRDSYVGLMGIDHKLLSKININDELTRDYYSTNMWAARYSSMRSELGISARSWEAVQLWGHTSHNKSYVEAIYPIVEPIDKPSVELPEFRKMFSESWMFRDFERTTSEGIQIRDTIPDAITSWAITGFSLNPNTGLALTKSPTTLKVFQSFFISMRLPTSVKEGEILAIPVYIFNYLGEDLMVNVTIEHQSDDLEFFEKPSLSTDTYKMQTKFVSANGIAKLLLYCRSHKPGRYSITAKAIASIASDAIQKTIVVLTEGIPHFVSKMQMIYFQQNGTQEHEISLSTYESTIQGSERVDFSVIGDICGRLMERLEELIRLPLGNGEESMRYTVSSLLVLKYLKTLNHSNPSWENRAKLYMELGYQTQLTFKHIDGSFSFSDRNEKSNARTGDVLLTAFVMWGLQQASRYIHVDNYVLERGFQYLRNKQNDSNGNFISGRGAYEDIKLTALTSLAFLANQKNADRYQDVLLKGLSYLYKAQDNLNCSTPSVLSAYALYLAKYDNSEELVATFSRNCRLKENPTRSTSNTLQFYLEWTASNFLDLLGSQNQSSQHLLGIVRCLNQVDEDKRSAINLIALDAMITFGQEINFASKNLDIRFSDDEGGSGNFHVDSENAQVLQTIQLDKHARRISVHANGTGYAVIDVKHSFNVYTNCSFSANVKANLTIQKAGSSLSVLKACIAIRTPGLQIDLIEMEVNLQSGYSIKEDMVDEFSILSHQVKSFKVNGRKCSVLFNMTNIGHDEICIQIEAFRAFDVYNESPSTIIVYDVHRTGKKTILSCGTLSLDKL